MIDKFSPTVSAKIAQPGPEPKMKTNKKPKYNPNKKSNKPQFKGNNPNNIKPKEKSLLRKILGLGIF